MFKLLKAAVVLLMLLLIINPGLSQDQKNSQVVLDKVSETYKTSRSYYFEAVVISEIKSAGLNMKTEAPITIAVMKPDKMRTQVSNPMMQLEVLIVSNGETTWEYMPNQKKYTKRESSVGNVDKELYHQIWASALGVIFPRYDRINEGITRARILPDEVIQIGGNDIDCYVVEAEFSPIEPNSESKPSTKSFWIDKTRNIVLKEISRSKMKTELGGPIERIQTTIFRTANINETLPDTLFIFAPPEGAKEVKDLNQRERKGKQQNR
jgi:outer membrane lipoprotein-sorting protein